LPDLDTYVPEGTRLKATIATESAAFTNPGTILSAISSDLEQNWNLHIEAYKDNTAIFFPQQYKFDVQLVTLSAFNSLRDVSKVLEAESWNLYKVKTLAVSIYSFQAPRDPAPQDTGSPKPAPSEDSSKPQPPWWKTLFPDFKLSTTGWITLGIVAVLTVMLLILAARPSTAGAVAAGFGGSRGRRAA
jgi:hypothetical protein